MSFFRSFSCCAKPVWKCSSFNARTRKILPLSLPPLLVQWWCTTLFPPWYELITIALFLLTARACAFLFVSTGGEIEIVEMQWHWSWSRDVLEHTLSNQLFALGAGKVVEWVLFQQNAWSVAQFEFSAVLDASDFDVNVPRRLQILRCWDIYGRYNFNTRTWGTRRDGQGKGGV